MEDVIRQEEENKLKALGFSGEDLQKRTQQRVEARLLLKKREALTPLTFWAVGLNKTDFGKGYNVKKAEQAYKTNPAQAIADGLTNSKGQSLEVDSSKKNFGKVIFAEDTYIYEGLDSNDKPVKLHFSAKQHKSCLPLFTVLKTEARTTNKEGTYYASNETKAIVERSFTYAETVELLKKHYSNKLVALDKFKEVAENPETRKSFIIVRGNVIKLVEGEEGRKSYAEISNGKTTIGCYFEPEQEINFSDMTQDIIIVGKPNNPKREIIAGEEQDKLVINVWGFTFLENFRVSKKPYVKPEEIIAKKEVWE